MVDHNRRKVLRLLASTPLLSGAAGFLHGCTREEAVEGPATAPAAQDPTGDKPTAKHAAAALPWQQKQRLQGLVECLGFASVYPLLHPSRDQAGLLIDFGTTDCFKYTMGGWRSGWGLNLERDGVAYTHATGTTSRINFHWEKSEELLARFRIQRVASTFFSLYVNGKPVEKVDIERVDWTTYTARIPAALVNAGVNQLLLRWEKAVPAMGEEVAAAVDYVYLQPAQAGDNGEPRLTRPASLVAKVDHGGRKAEALLLPANAQVSYLLQVPDLPEVVLGLHAAVLPHHAADESAEDEAESKEGQAAGAPMKLHVRALGDASPAKELFAAEVASSEFKPLEVDLSGLREQVVRLDIQASGAAGRLALLEPALYAARKAPATAAPGKPAKNVIVVMIDTLRADHTRTYAKTRVKAPAFESFAKAGAVFERYSAVEDWTKPSCATMLTGLYPVSHKTQTDGAKLPDAVRMVSEELKDQGVNTAAFIANGYVSDKFGFKRGWDHYTNYIRENRRTEAEHVFKEAYDWILERNKADQRFYAYVHTIDPHVPYDPPDEFLAMYDDSEQQAGDIKPRSTGNLLEDIKKGKFNPSDRDKTRLRALYDGEISYHDKWFGDFLEKLEKQGLLEDTLVIALSDHGEEFWEHGSVGHGHQIHQELVHVPFVMHWKGTIDGDVRIADNSDHCSLVPTIFDAMRLKPPAYLEGSSLLPQALGATVPGPHAGFSTHQNDREAVWSGRWKLVQNGPVNTYLYDVAEDRDCQKNLESDRPLTLCYMRALLGQFQGAQNKRRWRSRELEKAVAMRVQEEKIEIDGETRQQLENLGYFQ